MKKYFNILRKCPLFNDIDDNDLSTMLACLGTKILSFDKNDDGTDDNRIVIYDNYME